MKATELLEKIRENLKDYPIDYLKNKATDDRYPDSITKRLAIYNSGIYDEIYGNEIEEDFEIRDSRPRRHRNKRFYKRTVLVPCFNS